MRSCAVRASSGGIVALAFEPGLIVVVAADDAPHDVGGEPATGQKAHLSGPFGGCGRRSAPKLAVPDLARAVEFTDAQPIERGGVGREPVPAQFVRDAAIADVDKLLATKEKEILTV